MEETGQTYAQLLISFLYQIKTAILLWYWFNAVSEKNIYSAYSRRLIPASMSRTLFSQGDAPEEHEKPNVIKTAYVTKLCTMVFLKVEVDV